MIYEFDYITIRERIFPIIPLFVIRNDNFVPISALIDSGAFISLFNGGVAEALGIELEKGEKIYPIGISGKLLSYAHVVKLRIGDKDLEVKVAFSNELSTDMNMLGREGIFDKFDIMFKEREKKVIFEE